MGFLFGAAKGASGLMKGMKGGGGGAATGAASNIDSSGAPVEPKMVGNQSSGKSTGFKDTIGTLKSLSPGRGSIPQDQTYTPSYQGMQVSGPESGGNSFSALQDYLNKQRGL